jgi:hypothetical protein
MAKHRFKIRVEIETDEGVDGVLTTCIEVSNDYRATATCPVSSIAMTMAGVVKSIINSGRIVSPGTCDAAKEAFSDEMDQPLQTDYDEERLRKQNC